jgi:hypothetical protein
MLFQIKGGSIAEINNNELASLQRQMDKIVEK